MNIGYQAELLLKNNIKTTLENILAIFECIREYGVFEKNKRCIVKCL